MTALGITFKEMKSRWEQEPAAFKFSKEAQFEETQEGHLLFQFQLFESDKNVPFALSHILESDVVRTTEAN